MNFFKTSTLLIVGLMSVTSYSTEKFRTNGISKGGTHFPALATVVMNTNGPVLEFGCGDYSTPLLHALCAPKKRLLVSTDTDKYWIALFLDLECEWHKFVHVDAYGTANDPRNTWLHSVNAQEWDKVGHEAHWSVVFVDHAPGSRRPVEVARLRNNADVFIVHDSEDPRYGWEPLLSTFKYKYVYDRYNVTTTIVSDTIDITQWFK